MKQLYPIKFYNEKVGRPLYKAARKLGVSKGIALHVAHTPGSILHALPAFALGNPSFGLSLIIMSHCVFPKVMEQRHEDNIRERESQLEENLISA